MITESTQPSDKIFRWDKECKTAQNGQQWYEHKYSGKGCGKTKVEMVLHIIICEKKKKICS
jgi:hypothetical protein